MLIFGGSAEALRGLQIVTPSGQSFREVETTLHRLNIPCAHDHHNSITKHASTVTEDETPGLGWEWDSLDAQIFALAPEPSVYVPDPTLPADMLAMLTSETYADTVLAFPAVDATLPTTPTNTAHYALPQYASAPTSCRCVGCL